MFKMLKHVVFIVTAVLYSISSQNTQNSCECVPFYQCRQNGSIIKDGEGLFDIRLGEPCTSCNCTNVDETCCRLSNLKPAPSDPSRKSPLKGTCGYSNPDGVGFKIGVKGEETLFGEFPWMIEIFEGGSYRCGGSLIHPSVVLTAAHCVRSSASTYYVRGGAWDRSNTNQVLKHQDRNVSSIKIHDKYDIDTYINDVALVFLQQPFELKAHINTTCLIPANVVTDQRNCIATGWGKKNDTQEDTGSNILKKVELGVVSQSKCQEDLRSTRLGEYFILHDSFVCAGGEKDKDSCKGDGGGPLFCPLEEDEDRYAQVGVIAWGVDCNVENVPGVYANVAFVRKWIDQQMKNRNLDTQFYTF